MFWVDNAEVQGAEEGRKGEKKPAVYSRGSQKKTRMLISRNLGPRSEEQFAQEAQQFAPAQFAQEVPWVLLF